MRRETGYNENAMLRYSNAFAPGGSLYAFSFPNFRRFYWGQSISVAGTWMQIVAQQWLVYDLTHSAQWLGIVSGATAIPYAVFALWGGSLADRLPRRTILLCTQSVAMVFAFVLAVLATNRVVPVAPWHIALLAACSAVVNAFNMPAQQAFINEIVDDPQALPNAIALSSLRFNAARFVGPLLAGIALVKLGAAWCFLLNGVSFVAVLFSLNGIRTVRKSVTSTTPDDVSPIGGVRFLLSHVPLLRIVLMVGTASVTALAVSTLFPVLANDFHRGKSGFSTLVTANGLGAMTGGLLLVLLAGRVSGQFLIWGGTAVLSLGLLAAGFAPTFGMTLSCLFCAGVGMVVFLASANTVVQTAIPNELRGRVMAVYLLVVNSAMPVGGLLLGFLAHRLTVQPTVRLAAGATLAVGVVLWLWGKQDRTVHEIG